MPKAICCPSRMLFATEEHMATFAQGYPRFEVLEIGAGAKLTLTEGVLTRAVGRAHDARESRRRS